MDIEEFKRGFITRGEPLPDDILGAYTTGLPPEVIIQRRRQESLHNSDSHQSSGASRTSSNIVSRTPLFPRLVRLAKVMLVVTFAGLAIMFAFDLTRPITYIALASLTQPTIIPGSELAHIRQVVPGTTNHGPKDGHLKALRGAPVEWERMNAKQRTALASVHAIFVSNSFYPDLTIKESQWNYLQKAIPSYLSAYANTDPIYSRMLSEFYLKDIGGRNQDAALTALAHGSSDAMPSGRGRISNWFAYKALAGQIANRARTQDARATSR
ncbi:hypothetical protein [Pseudoxanthomonas japonensis]|uniref:hypothetical protein n=1 Tax=Pseudoxanthomonas japonensis TaxID=69284 RepID=UPI00374872A9